MVPVSTARLASCTCGKVRESSPDLDFFQDRGPGTQDNRCAACRFDRIAHEYDPRRVRPGPHPATVGHAFSPMTEGYELDTFACGCRGWD